jgi:flagellar biosynthetic protein FliQ
LELLLEHVGKGFFYIIIISMPIVLTAAGIGLVVGILQAVTQVQEQTIAAAPKILAVFLVILIGGVMIVRILHNYLTDAIKLSLETIPQSGNNALPPEGWVDPNKSRYEFFNDTRFKRRKDKPSFSELISKPADSPFLRTKDPKEPDVYTPAPPIPDASIAEEIENYKNMQGTDRETRAIPSTEQKTPVIPPLSTPDTNPSISVLPNLDEPPAVDPSEINSKNQIASGYDSNSQQITGAAAYLTPDGQQDFNYKVKGSTIIIQDNEKNTSYSSNNSYSKQKIKNNRGAIILEAE